jgi:uncharacterized membrane protein YcaP (DUF421 family)
VDTVIRTPAIYLIIVVLFRVTGKRTMSQVTTVDLVLLLVISEATQQALLGNDFSLTTAALVIVTLVFFDRFADLLKFKSKKFSKLVEGAPVVLVAHGRPLEQRLRKEHLNVDDVLAAARSQRGLLRLDQIDYAILEGSGGISIIPATDTASRDRAGGETSAPPGA